MAIHQNTIWKLSDFKGEVVGREGLCVESEGLRREVYIMFITETFRYWTSSAEQSARCNKAGTRCRKDSGERNAIVPA